MRFFCVDDCIYLLCLMVNFEMQLEMLSISCFFVSVHTPKNIPTCYSPYYTPQTGLLTIIYFSFCCSKRCTESCGRDRRGEFGQGI